MQVISIEQMKDMIKHVCFRLNKVVGFVGPSGCGKTEGSRQATEEAGAIFLPFLLGQYDSVDLKGFPGVETHAGGYKNTVWYPASTLPFKGNPAFDENGPLIHVFFDETNHANQAVLGFMYQVMDARRAGEHILMDNVRLSCAMNGASDKGINNRMPSPLDNRITYAETQPNIKDWAMNATRLGISQVVIAFLTWRKDLLHTFDPAKPEKCFGTGRSWVRAGEYFGDTTMPDWLIEASISGSVGRGNCGLLYAFVNHWEHVQKLMPMILKSPSEAEVPKELSMRYALALSICGSMELTNVDVYDIYLARMPAEFRVMAWNLATTYSQDDEKNATPRFKRAKGLYKSPAFIKFSRENRAIWEG
jgi:hypothetical protein